MKNYTVELLERIQRELQNINFDKINTVKEMKAISNVENKIQKELNNLR